MPQFLLILLAIAIGLYLLVMLVWVLFVGAVRLLGIIVVYSVIVAGLAFLAGTVLGLVMPYRVMRGRTPRAPRIASADAVRDGHVFTGEPTGASRHFGWDFAWPLYAPYQLKNDQVAVSAEAKRLCAAVFRKTRGWWPRGSNWFTRGFFAITWFVIFGIPTLGLILGIALGTLLWLALTSVFQLLVTVVQKVALSIMRAREARFMKQHNASVRCTRCYQMTDMPSFVCSNASCGTIHRDMAPGRLGILSRICGCEERLPVTVAQASRSLEAVCPHCDASLPAGSGTRRVVVVPVFGSVGAGKTQFLSSSAVALHEGGEQLNPTLTLTALNDPAAQFLSASVQERAHGQAPVKTPHQQRPEGYPFLIERAEGACELHLMDAAGENFVGADGTTELRYLDVSQSLVFLLDPLTIPEVGEQLQLSPLTGSIQVAQGTTSDAYGSVIDRLRDSGVNLDKRQLAVVVTKQDVISRIMPDQPLPRQSEQIRDWLFQHGEDRLITRLEMDFTAVEYFAVSSTEVDQAGDPSHPLQVMDWAIRQHGGASVYPQQPPAGDTSGHAGSQIPETTEARA